MRLVRVCTAREAWYGKGGDQRGEEEGRSGRSRQRTTTGTAMRDQRMKKTLCEEACQRSDDL
jgi:hypothetical protein